MPNYARTYSPSRTLDSDYSDTQLTQEDSVNSGEQPSHLRSLALSIAHDVVKGDIGEWEADFCLARRLRRVLERDASEDILWEPFNEYFDAMLVHGYYEPETREGKWLQFLQYFSEDVRFAEGETVIDWAADNAKRVIVEPVRNLRSSDAVLVASIAYLLQQAQGSGRPILLPVKEIGRVLGKTKQYASIVISSLVRIGILKELNDGQWSWSQHEAKEYLFTDDSSLYRITVRERN